MSGSGRVARVLALAVSDMVYFAEEFGGMEACENFESSVIWVFVLQF